jgi:predicted RNase H-like nuclease
MVAKALPYKAIAGVTPCPGGWLVLPARLSGVTVVAEEAFVLPNLMEVLDYRPKFEFAGINVPMGLLDEPNGQYRPCDLEAREMLGWPRMVGIYPVPSRPALLAATREEALKFEPWLTRDDFRRFRWLREAAREIQPFHQRSFYAANPDLSFFVMNGDQPLKTSPFHEDGRLQRVELVRERLPGVDDVITRVPPPGAGVTHMLQAAAMLWTARRASGRAVSRLPSDPTWDTTGLRIELVR